MTEAGRFQRYDALTVRYIKEIRSRDVAEVLDDLSQDFFGITVQRETFRIGAGGIGITEAAVVFVIATTAAGFLSELGKDAYRSTRDLFWDLYQKHTVTTTPTGRFEPMSVVLGRDAAGIYFIYGEKLSRDEFMEALLSMGSAAEQVEDIPDEKTFPWWYEFRVDPRSGGWKLVHSEFVGKIDFDEGSAPSGDDEC